MASNRNNSSKKCSEHVIIAIAFVSCNDENDVSLHTALCTTVTLLSDAILKAMGNKLTGEEIEQEMIDFGFDKEEMAEIRKEPHSFLFSYYGMYHDLDGGYMMIKIHKVKDNSCSMIYYPNRDESFPNVGATLGEFLELCPFKD